MRRKKSKTQGRLPQVLRAAASLDAGAAGLSGTTRSRWPTGWPKFRTPPRRKWQATGGLFTVVVQSPALQGEQAETADNSPLIIIQPSVGR